MRYWQGMALLCAVALGAHAAPGANGEYVFVDGRWVQAAAPAEGTAAGEIEIVREHIDAGRNKKAVKAARKLLVTYPDARQCEEAMLLAGQAEFNRKRYYKAFQWFDRQVSNYGKGPHFDRALDRQFQIAEKFLTGHKRVVMGVFRLSARDEGLEILLRIAEHAPGSTLAQKALMRIGDYHFARQEHDAAVQAYDSFLDQFGKTAMAPAAMLKAARATLASFRGIRYDDTALIEAEQRFKMYAERFPLSANDASIRKDMRRIGALRARKLYDTGRFYQRTGKPTAAGFYYRKVARNYPASPSAKPAARALEALGPRGQRRTVRRRRAPTARPAGAAAGPRKASPSQ